MKKQYWKLMLMQKHKVVATFAVIGVSRVAVKSRLTTLPDFLNNMLDFAGCDDVVLVKAEDGEFSKEGLVSRA